MPTNDFFRESARQLLDSIDGAKKHFKKHLPSLGYVGEELLRCFLRDMLNSCRFSVTQGFISHKGEMSKQCDIIIYDPTRDAEGYHVGEVSIVSLGSVVAVIEVKTSISKRTWQTTLDEIKILADWGIHNFYLFVYEDLTINTLKTFLFGHSISTNFIVDASPKYDHGDESYLPKCICSIRSNVTYSMSIVDCGRDALGYLSVEAYDHSEQPIASLHEFLSNIYFSISNSHKCTILPDINYYKRTKGLILYDL